MQQNWNMKERIQNIKITPSELKKICKDYEYDEQAHMMIDEGQNETPHLIKKAMTYLDRADFVIFCLYMEYQSERKVADLLGCSRTPLHYNLVKTKKKILERL